MPTPVNPKKIIGPQTDIKVHELTDTAITTPANGDLLTWQGSQWINSPSVSAPSTQLFTLTSSAPGTHNASLNETWNYSTPLSYAQESYITHAKPVDVSVFTFATQGMYEFRIMCTANASPTSSSDDYIYGVDVSAINVISQTRSQHHRISPHNNAVLMSDGEKISWVDTFVVSGQLGQTLTIGAYAASYNNTGLAVSFDMTVVVERLGNAIVGG